MSRVSLLVSVALLAAVTPVQAQDFGPESFVDDTVAARGARQVRLGDVDGDGDLDMCVAAAMAITGPGGPSFLWYENLDGAGNFGPWQGIGPGAGASSIALTDIDGDGDLDAFTVARDAGTVSWYENTDGAGTFALGQAIAGGLDEPYFVVATDVDGDGDDDAVVSSVGESNLRVFVNTDGAGVFAQNQLVPSSGAIGYAIATGDLDGDGDEDLVAARRSSERVSWFEKLDGSSFFGPEQVISTLVLGSSGVDVADVDNDGDLDVLSASIQDDTHAWYENLDGLATFGPQQVITTAINGPGGYSLSVGDLDGDCDVDLVSTGLLGDSVHWIENLGAGAFAPPTTISTQGDRPRGTDVGDLNGDGRLDLVVTWESSNEVAWHENLLPQMAPPLPSLGTALTGTYGDPLLTGAGCFSSDTITTVTLTNALENTPAFLVVGLSQVNLAAKGGVLVPEPFIVLSFATNASGEINQAFILPPDVTLGVDLYLQYWLIDPAGIVGYASSAALQGTTTS